MYIFVVIFDWFLTNYSKYDHNSGRGGNSYNCSNLETKSFMRETDAQRFIFILDEHFWKNWQYHLSKTYKRIVNVRVCLRDIRFTRTTQVIRCPRYVK